jgi:hypothetical protein
MQSIGIGKLAERAGVRVDTIRYYERNGLMAPSARHRRSLQTWRRGSQPSSACARDLRSSSKRVRVMGAPRTAPSCKRSAARRANEQA